MDVDEGHNPSKSSPRENEGGGSGASKGREGGTGAGRAGVKIEESTDESARLVKSEIEVEDGAGRDNRSDKRKGRADGGGSPERDERANAGDGMGGQVKSLLPLTSPAAAGTAGTAAAAAGASAAARGGGGGVKGGEEKAPEGSDRMVLIVGFYLVRHAMQDTFGEDAVTADATKAEIDVSTDGARAKLRVVVSPPPTTPPQPPRPLSSNSGGAGAEGGAGAGAAVVMAPAEASWRCEVVECGRDSLRSQIVLLVERLRVAVSKS